MCGTEIKNYKPDMQLVLVAVLNKEMEKRVCKGNLLPVPEGEAVAGDSLIYSNTLEHQ